MTQRTDIQSMAGATLSISATRPDTFDEAGYQSTDIIWSEIGEVEDHGNHGVRATITEFTPVGTAVVAKIKGSKNYGTKSVMLGYVPGNAGQVIVAAASESLNRYSLKVQYALGNGEATPEIHYLDALVGSGENQDGTVDNVRRLMVEFAICRKPIVVAAT